MDKETFIAPKGLLQALADYLATRPFREVAHFMEALSYVKPVDPAEDDVS